MLENISMKLNPYLGKSKNLIEFFVIIGYEEKVLLEYEKENNLIENNLEISIISSVSSDLSYGIFNPEKVIKQIYPDKPKIIKIIKSELKPKPNSVLFYSCFDSMDGANKILYSCYALRFYEELKTINGNRYYIPKAFLIFSQYPYFTTFYDLCLNIYEQKDENNVINNLPVEILLYCLVNYIPSPIVNNLKLKMFPGKNEIIINKLTGYPYIDFNLGSIFNIISIDEFIKIFMLTFLEISLLFFSPDLVKLNLLMFIYNILNYPLIDSNYYWHIKSISKDEIEKGDDTINPNFRGVNTAFKSSFDFSNFIDLNFIVDIDNQMLKSVEKELNQENLQINKLLNYFKKILSNKKVNSYFLKNNLILLKTKLNKIKNDYEKIIKNLNINNIYFFVDKNIKKINLKIQESFYDFIIELLIIIYKDYKFDDKKFDIVQKIEDNHNFSEEEVIFLNLYRKCIKYNTYFDRFIRDFAVIGDLKIPLVFSDEFVNARINDTKNEIPTKINYFSIINKFYCLNPKETIFNIEKLNEEINKTYKQQSITGLKGKSKNQLFELDKNLIKIFLFNKKSRELFNSLKIKEKEEVEIISIEKGSIIYVIENLYHSILNPKHYITGSIIYIFSIVFPLFPHKKIMSFLNQILFYFSNIKFFQRYYLYVLLKSIHKYYIINQETGHFPELILENIKSYYILIKNYLIKTSIIPNKEIFLFLKNILSDEKIPNIEEKKPKKIDEKKYFVFKYVKEENYSKDIKIEEIFTKHKNSFVFSYKSENKYYIISNKMEKEEKLQLSQEIKQGNIITLSNPPFLHQMVYSLYDNYYTNLKFNIENINIKDIIEKIIIIFFYLLSDSVKDKNIRLTNYLLDSIIVLENLENDLKPYKENNIIENNNINNNHINIGLINNTQINEEKPDIINNDNDNQINIINNEQEDNNNNL